MREDNALRHPSATCFRTIGLLSVDISNLTEVLFEWMASLKFAETA
jgi:hypothetical protein